MKHFGKLLEGNPPHTEIKGTIMKIGARNDSSAKKYLTSRFTAQDSTQTEKMQVIHALGQIRDSEKLQEILDFGLEKMPRNNNWILLVSMSSNPEAAQTLWAWFRENTKEFVEKTTESYVGRV